MKYLIIPLLWILNIAVAFGVDDMMLSDGVDMFYYQGGATKKRIGMVACECTMGDLGGLPAGTNYFGGFYNFASSANDFNPGITFGSSNGAYAGKLVFVAAAGTTNGTDTVVRVTGTTYTLGGVRTTGVTEDVTLDDAGTVGTYYETTNRWLGQVSIAKQSGVDFLCNYGSAESWNHNNNDFMVVGLSVFWRGATNDASPNISIRHHKSTGWTYNAAGPPTPPAAIASMATDYGADIKIIANDPGNWKRNNLSTQIKGDGGEGVMIELITTTDNVYATGTFRLRIKPN
ncbi:MAG: hypothetical protein ACYTEQ_03340 [Planctomycetota bacterium]|jgi:hypothetical protein